MTVHSTQLGAAAAVGVAGVTVYTVPAGKRTILKGIWLRNTGGAANVAKLELTLVGGTSVFFYVNLDVSANAGNTVFLNLWVVMNAGDALKMTAAVNSVNIIASGAELTL